MSRVHIRFCKEEEQNSSISYKVYSSDFNESNNWEPIAKVIINIIESSYTYTPEGFFEKNKVIPPYVYDMPSENRNDMLKNTYKDFAFGGWTSKISKMARTVIESNEFPEEIHGIT